MKIFGSKKKISLGRNSSAGDDDFDFQDMSDEFGDEHNVPTSRKATIKNYATAHVKNKFTDRNERKKLMKSALPNSYSGPIDLAHDLKDDFDEIKYSVSKEWEKTKTPLKKLLKTNAGFLRTLRLGKIADWSEEDDRSRAHEEEVNSDEALVQSMLSEFTNPQQKKEKQKRQQAEQKIKQEIREDESEYRSQSLSAQLQGTVNSGAALAELRRLTNYQDQVTFLYQKKSLEVGIRSLLEHRKQTDILKVYKDESIAELKEIHKNTALPEAVKINQSEMAAQIFKEKMIGRAAGWFDGKAAPVRKRIMTRIKTKLTDMTRDLGTNLTGMSEMMDQAREGGDSAQSLFAKMAADKGLDTLWGKATKRPLNWIRNKLGQNEKIRRFGKGMQAANGNLGGLLNSALTEGSSGNKHLDKFIDWAGLRQAAVSRDDTMRQSLSKNLDTAQYMDVKFKQTVERVIPHWLSLIHKENYLIRMGMGFKEGDGKNGTIEHKQKAWDWDKDGLVNVDDKKTEIKSQLFDKDRIENYAFALERLLRHIGSGYLQSNSAYEKLKKWVISQVTAGKMATHYDLLLSLKIFSKQEQENVKLMIATVSGLLIEQIEDDLEHGQFRNFALLFDKHNTKYVQWINEYARLASDFAGKSVMDWSKIQELVDQGHHHVLEEMGILNRNTDGSFSRNIKFETDSASHFSKVAGRKTGVLKARAIEDRNWKDSNGKMQKGAAYEFDESKSRAGHEDFTDANDLVMASDIVSFFRDYMTHEKITEKQKKEYDKQQKNRGSELYQRKAAGGYIGRFAKGGSTDLSNGGSTGDGPIDGPVEATLDGKEFVTDATTTEKNAKLLTLMNKFKTSVVMPDGRVNPVYYKAFGFKNEDDFRMAHGNKKLTEEHREVAASAKQMGGGRFITSLFESIDASKLSDAQLTTLSDPKWKSADVIQMLAKIKKEQEKKTIGDRIRGAASGTLGLLAGGNTKANAVISEHKEKAISFGKKLMSDAKKDLAGFSEETREALFWKIATHTEPTLITEAEHVYFEDESISWADKITKISNINIYRGNGKIEFLKNAFIETSESLGQAAKSKMKNWINGSKTDTTTTDDITKIAGSVKKTVLDTWGKRGVAVNYALEKLRMKKARDLAFKHWKDEAVDVYIVGSPTAPRLTKAGFVNGEYIDQSSGRVCASHHDITGSVVLADGTVVITPMDIIQGFCDKEGNVITVSDIKRMRNVAKEKTVEAYNKYAKKHVDKLAGSMLSLTEKWQNVFKKHAIDVYVGEGKDPILTATGFSQGKYFSSVTKKPLSGWLDIDGPVMDISGTYLINKNDLESSLLFDKEGNALTPPKLQSNLKRLQNIVFKAVAADKIMSMGKKAWGKIKAFSAKQTAKRFTGMGASAVDVYINLFPYLMAVDFRAGKLIDTATGKPLANHYQITGPVSKLKDDGTSEIVLTQEQLEKGGFTDVNGKPLSMIHDNFLKGSFYKALGSNLMGKLKGSKAFGHLTGLKGKLLGHWRTFKTKGGEMGPPLPPTEAMGPNKPKPGIYHKNQIDGSLTYLFNADDMRDGRVYSVDPHGDPENGANLCKITSFDYIHTGTTLYVVDDLTKLEDKVITWALLRQVGREVLKSAFNDGQWRDEKGKKLNAKGLKALEDFGIDVSAASDKIKSSLKGSIKGIWSTMKVSFKQGLDMEAAEPAPADKDVYHKDAGSRALTRAFSMGELAAGQVYMVDPSGGGGGAVSKASTLADLKPGVFVYLVTDPSKIKEGTVLTTKWLMKNASLVVSATGNSNQWFDSKGKKLNSAFKSMLNRDKAKLKGMLSGAGNSIKNKLAGWKDKAFSLFTGRDAETKELRKGSWQEKLANKTKDSWIGKLAGAMGVGKKPVEGEKKKSWLSRILMSVVGVGTAIIAGVKNSIGWLAKKMFSGVAEIAKKLITGPLTRALTFLGTKIASGMGRAGGFLGRNKSKIMGAGRMLGAAGLAYSAIGDFKGEPKLDENGDPILDKDGKPVMEQHKGMGALKLAGSVAMIPGAMGVIGSAVGGAAALLAPIALPLAAIAAVGYGAYKLYQFGKKKDAERDYPITAFRMNQYGFSITDQNMVDKMVQLESVLKPYVTIQGESVNFKSDIDVNAVFGVFDLNYDRGDKEKNQKFLAWFLGRFKPVYVSYIKVMMAVKKTSDLNGIEKKLTPAEALTVLDKVHFKNQSTMNPYNIMISPVDDPDECDYDFEDVQKRYENTADILKDKAKDMSESGDVGTLDDSKKKEDAEKDTIIGGFKNGFKKGGVIGGIVGGSINILKKIGSGVGDIFNSSVKSIKEGWTNLTKGLTDGIAKKWQEVKDMFKGISEFITDPVAAVKKLAKKHLSKGASDAVAGAADVASNVATSVADSTKSLGASVSSGWGSVTQFVAGNGKGGWHRNKPAQLEAWVAKYSKQYGMSARDMLTYVMTESNGNPNAKAGSFVGLMQMGPDAVKEVGMNWQEVATNPEKNVEAGIKYAAKNTATFKKSFGRDPKPYELYLMHQQGAKGFSRVVDAANGKPPSGDDLTSMYKSMKTNGGEGKTPAQFLKYWEQRFAQSDAAANGAGSSPATSPTIGTKPSPAVAAAAAASPVGAKPSAAAGGSAGSSSGGTATMPASAGAGTGGGGSSPTTAATPAGAGKAQNGLAKYLAMVTPALISAGRNHCSIAKNTTMEGVNENVANLFYAMIGDAVAKGCPPVLIKEGVRSLAEQKRLYNEYISCKAAGKKAVCAAVPGTSRHGFGFAIDVNPKPTVEFLVSKGFLEKWGFERNLLATLKEWWHIEHKLLKPAGTPPPKIPPPVADKTKTAGGTEAAPTAIAPPSSAVNTGNTAINAVVNKGGGANTSTVTTAQRNDSDNSGAVAAVLAKSLAVQTDTRDVLVQIRDHLIKQTDPKAQQELMQLKNPKSTQSAGAELGDSIATMLAEKFGIGKTPDTPKPIPVISSSK